MITCADGKVWQRPEAVCVGSVHTVRSRDVSKPPRVGEFPVLVDQTTTRMFTYSSKITTIEG